MSYKIPFQCTQCSNNFEDEYCVSGHRCNPGRFPIIHHFMKKRSENDGWLALNWDKSGRCKFFNVGGVFLRAFIKVDSEHHRAKARGE